MKPIERGMTVAVTRDGRKVTQLTWFDGIENYFCVAGVLEGKILLWREDGTYADFENVRDIFAPVEYEWQWLYQSKDGSFNTTFFHYKTYDDMIKMCGGNGKKNFKRIEESKTEVLTE